MIGRRIKKPRLRPLSVGVWGGGALGMGARRGGPKGLKTGEAIAAGRSLRRGPAVAKQPNWIPETVT